MDDNRLQKQMEFCRLIDAEKKIGRQTYLADASRKENDAEHAWHMAIMTLLLSEYSTVTNGLSGVSAFRTKKIRLSSRANFWS